MDIKPEAQIHLNKFKPRSYQLPLWDAIENKGYKRVLAILPRRAGKDVTAWNLCIRQALRKPMVIYYLFPTFAQAKRVIWNSLTNDGESLLDYIPKQLIASKNGQEMRIQFTNGSIIQLVGSDNFDCFDDQTEILTQEGWVLFKDLNPVVPVATRVDGDLVFEKPLKYVTYDYDGPMYCIRNSGTDFKVTPNHRFYVRSSKGIYKFKKISDPTIRHHMVPSTSGWQGVVPNTFGYNPEDWFAFVGIFISEGSTYKNKKGYRVTISQVKPSIRKHIESLLKRMGLNYVSTHDRFNIENKALYEYCASLGKQTERFIPKELKNAPQSLLYMLFDWLIKGDGYSSPSYTAYYSISKQLIDDVQEIIIKLGLSGNVHIKTQKESYINGRTITARHTLYEIRVRKSQFKRLHGSAGNPYIFTEDYTGKVYCVSVPSGVIKVRRNGKEMWSGNSLMGTNPSGVVFSEYALQDPRAYQYIRPILTANDGWALFISTPRGKNHLWTLYQIAQEHPDWFCYKLTIEDTKHISMHEIERERSEGIMSEDLIQQEYFTSFQLGVEGAFYAKYLDSMRSKGQISDVPWENGFSVHTAWDLGISNTSIIFFQVIGQTVRIIDCYSKHKEGLEHYVRILQEKPYTYGKHIFPHDVAVRELGTGMTRVEKLRQLDITATIAPRLSVVDGIEAVRSTLSRVWFDEHKCHDLLRALENYRQEYDAKKRVYKGFPLHDEHSHYADAMRYLCISLGYTRKETSPEDLERRYQQAMYGSDALPGFFSSHEWPIQ